MSNVFASLPVPAGNGAGAAVDVSAAGSLKAIVVTGAFQASLNIEVSEDGVTFETAATYTGPTTDLLVAAAKFMRVTVAGYVSGTPKVAIGADGLGGTFVTLAVPPGDGVGAATDVSAAGSPKTIVVGGVFEAAVTIEISEDGITFGAIPGVPSFVGPEIATTPVVAKFVRVRISGYVSGTPVVAVGSSTVVGGGIAANLKVPDGGGTRVIIFARSTGSDATGDGTLANPYRTFQRCLLDVPVVLYGTRYVLDLSGIGIEALPDGFRLPVFLTPDGSTLNFAAEYPPFFFEAPLTINATPTTLATITAGQITAQAADPDTGLITIKTTNVYVPNAFKGKVVVGAGFFEFATIASNTASDLETCGTTILTAPLTIVEPSAQFTNANAGNFDPVFQIQDPGLGVGLNGIGFLSGAGGTDGLNLDQARLAVMFLCDVAGADLGEIFSCFAFANYWHNVDLVMTGCAPFLGASFFEGLTDYRQYGNGGLGATNVQGIFEGCGVIGPVGSDGLVDGIFELDNAWVRGGVDPESVQFRTGSRHHRLQNVKITGGAGHAVHSTGPAYLELINVRGAGNGGFGVKLDVGGQCLVGATTDVTGAMGDMKVGGKAMRTWANFRTVAPINNEADFFVPATSDGSHLQQP